MIDRDYSPPGQPSKKKATLQPSPKKNPPAPKLVVPQVDDDPYSAALKASKSPNAWVEKWMKRYAESPDQAIDQFLQLIIACCGCSGKLNAKMIHNMEIKDIITRLSDYFDEDSADYPLVMASPAWNNFRSNLAAFLRLFIVRCKDKIIYDAELMNPLIKLLAGLSKSKIRAFRHTATFAAMKIASAIVDIVVELVELKEKNATQQIETEKEKVAQQMGSNERLELLLAAEAELDGKIEELSAKTKIMFCKVFAHRYKSIPYY